MTAAWLYCCQAAAFFSIASAVAAMSSTFRLLRILGCMMVVFTITGIIAATLGGLNPLGVGLGALFIGLIDTGAQTVSSAMGIPIYLGNMVEATLLLVTLGMFILPNYRIKRV